MGINQLSSYFRSILVIEMCCIGMLVPKNARNPVARLKKILVSVVHVRNNRNH